MSNSSVLTISGLTKKTIICGLFASVIVGCGGADTSQTRTEETTQVQLKDVPEDVKNVVMSMSPKFEMVEVLKKQRDGRTYFDVEGELPSGKEIEFDVLMTDDGPKVVEVQRDITWKAVPRGAKRVVRKANTDKDKIVRVIESKQADTGTIIYEIFIEGHPEKPRFEVSVAGNLPAELLDTPWKH